MPSTQGHRPSQHQQMSKVQLRYSWQNLIKLEGILALWHLKEYHSNISHRLHHLLDSMCTVSTNHNDWNLHVCSRPIGRPPKYVGTHTSLQFPKIDLFGSISLVAQYLKRLEKEFAPIAAIFHNGMRRAETYGHGILPEDTCCSIPATARVRARVPCQEPRLPPLKNVACAQACLIYAPHIQVCYWLAMCMQIFVGDYVIMTGGELYPWSPVEASGLC